MSKSSSPRPNYTKDHDRLRDQILTAVSMSGLAMVWPNETGSAYRGDDGRPPSNLNRLVRIDYGCIGSPDILGIAIGGFAVGIEVKTLEATLSKQQLKFRAAFEAKRGIFIVGRAVEGVLFELTHKLELRGVDTCKS